MPRGQLNPQGFARLLLMWLLSLVLMLTLVLVLILMLVLLLLTLPGVLIVV